MSCRWQLLPMRLTCGGDRRYLFVGSLTVAACSASISRHFALRKLKTGSDPNVVHAPKVVTCTAASVTAVFSTCFTDRPAAMSASCTRQRSQLELTCGGDRRYLFVGRITVAACLSSRKQKTGPDPNVVYRKMLFRGRLPCSNLSDKYRHFYKYFVGNFLT